MRWYRSAIKVSTNVMMINTVEAALISGVTENLTIE